MATSAQILTDIQTMITTGPTAATTTKANAAAGPITDVPGSFQLLQAHGKEMKQLAQQVLNAMDAGDPMKSTLQNIHDTFV